ncbi:MAG: hypothetical protein V3W17_02560, partial [Desulfobacteria bacterium]
QGPRLVEPTPRREYRIMKFKLHDSAVRYSTCPSFGRLAFFTIGVGRALPADGLRACAYQPLRGVNLFDEIGTMEKHLLGALRMRLNTE